MNVSLHLLRCCNLSNLVVKRGAKSLITKNRKYNVYKTLGYKLTLLSDERKATMLDFINNCKEKDELRKILGIKGAGDVYNFIQDHGKLEALEQLLDIKGIEILKLERYAKAYEKSLSKNTTEKFDDKKLLQRTIPSLNVEDLQNMNLENGIVAFKFNLASLSFVHLNQGNLVRWSAVPACKPLVDKSSFQHHNLIKSCRDFIDAIPQNASIYVYEELPKIMKNDVATQMKMKYFILESGLLATLATLNQSSQIYLLKYNAFAQEFNVKLGKERSLLSDKLISVLGEHPFVEKDVLQTEQWNEFLHLKREEGMKHTEQLSEALLTGLTLDITIKKLLQNQLKYV